MNELRSSEWSEDRTVVQLFLADTDSHREGYEALALTKVEFDAVRRPSVTGWRHFLRLQKLESAGIEFDLKTAADMLAKLSWTPNDFLELLAGVHADVGEAPALALPELQQRLLVHHSQLQEVL